MGMFGFQGGQLGMDMGGGVASPSLLDKLKGMFGNGMAQPGSMGQQMAPGGAADGFMSQQQSPAMLPKLTLANKLGMAGDILTRQPVFTPMIEQERNEQLAFAKQANQQAQEFQRQFALKQYEQANPAPTEFDRTLTAGGVTPSDPRWATLHYQKAQNDADPIHAYPTTDAAGNEGLIFKRPSEMGAAGTPPVQIKGAADYAALPPGAPYIDPQGQHRVKGGAAPATGPGGFPLYPTGDRRSGAR